MKKNIVLILLSFTFASFGQNNEQLFKTKLKATAIVNDTVDLDKYKNLIIIPGGHFRKDLEKINYFSNIMTRNEVEKECKKRGLNKDKYNFDSIEGIKNLLSDYGSFIYVYESISNEDKNIRQIIIDIPYKGNVFVVEGRQKTNVIGYSAGTKYLPLDMNNAMLNELVEYIRHNSKTYK